MFKATLNGDLEFFGTTPITACTRATMVAEDSGITFVSLVITPYFSGERVNFRDVEPGTKVVWGGRTVTKKDENTIMTEVGVDMTVLYNNFFVELPA